MLIITLDDGSKHCFNNSISLYDLIVHTHPNMVDITIAGRVNNNIVDTNFIIDNNAIVSFITITEEIGLYILRHSCSHLLAQSVKELFPETKLALGPVIQDGFYYDFDYKRIFNDHDLIQIEKKMHEIVQRSLNINKITMNYDEALSLFTNNKEIYKIEILKELYTQKKNIYLYQQGNFIDLCKGPHVFNTSYLKFFKILRIAGSYWRGDSNNKVLTRIYGTCWDTKEHLDKYLTFLSESEKRDHRKISQKLELCHFQEESPGIPFWHPKGMNIWRVIEDYMRKSNIKFGYSEIKTPLIADMLMWEKSGHAKNYYNNMFITNSENREYAVRPMNCPTCIQIYNNKLHSYRDLPIRMNEFGIVHRNEASGGLHGLLRVRSFMQDDGHIFCRENQIELEVTNIIKQCFEVYQDFGFKDFEIKLALRPKKRIGNDDLWDNAEKSLELALKNNKVQFDYLPGEGAFYGPKIEFHLNDAIGRTWQCGTIQLDLSMPIKLNAQYIDENSDKKNPVLLHRAILGSFERFIGILIEHYEGKFPLWLAPIQIIIIGINNDNNQYVTFINTKLQEYEFRTQIDLRNKSIGFKIREHTLSLIPFMVILGEKEQNLKKLSVRKQNGSTLGLLNIENFIKILLKEIKDKKH